MNGELLVYNTLTRKKEVFSALNPPFVGMYVCGPTVYGDAHLGHARPAITFDTVFRYLTHKGYKVRYVRNITDVGHLENDADSGEDKIAKKARLEQLEPMEIVQHYTEAYHNNMSQLNVTTPSIEPHASGHISEQIEMIQQIINNGFAYEKNGSVYFNVPKYHEGGNNYGKLSGRIIEDLLSNTRELEGQEEKNSPLDFALWKNAGPEHIMKWPSPWGLGFPGWHIECSAMSSKYLGEQFDIHGGGMDLLFPHHECEIAQSNGSNKKDPVKYWLHNNMITINGQKMGKSLGNFITLDQFFSGDHKLLNSAYSPMTIRFFILQAHYRSTLDFSNDALIAARKAYKKIINGLVSLRQLDYKPDAEKMDPKSNEEVKEIFNRCYAAMDDDFNTAIVIAELFHALKIINSLLNKTIPASLTEGTFNDLKTGYQKFVTEILGLVEEDTLKKQSVDQQLHLVIELYKKAKAAKDYATVDIIRAEAKKSGILLKDSKEGVLWSYEE